jgi:hypothetical protein
MARCKGALDAKISIAVTGAMIAHASLDNVQRMQCD